MPSKKKKYNARFPPAVQITSARNAKTLSPAHLKQCILAESRFDFLKDLVLSIPDVQADGEDSGVASVPSTPTAHQNQPLMFRSLSEAGSSSSTSRSKGTGRPRGRPRKTPTVHVPVAQNNQRTWAARKSDSEDTDSGDSEDDEDDENNSTDTDSLPKGSSSSKNGRDTTPTTAHQASVQFNAVQPNFYQEIGGQRDFMSDGPHKIILRPKTVQERIRDLNMQARQFANAVTAIQNGGNSRVNGVSGRSLQVTPWGSPRLLSPVDIRHIVPEYGDSDRDPRYSPGVSPNRYRWSRNGSMHRHRVEIEISEDNKLKEVEQLWLDEKDKIIQQLGDLLSIPQREITFQEAQYLTAILASNDDSLTLGALSVLVNLAVFSSNQENLREAGLIAVLPKLILNPTRQLKQKACMVAANMAINEKNNAGNKLKVGDDMRSVTISLVYVIQAIPLSDPGLLTSALMALVNVAVLPSWHHEIKTLLHKTYSLLDEGHWSSDGESFHSLRLLINLSCNEEMVPSLLAAQEWILHLNMNS
uniref:EOG090X0H1B n=1 Tax=Simocephalus serrulatus TaxID=117539 RepID=A0A4Y7NMV7_9CRUS|nr:EOG090X0H1B [Simocephalus serrulatus]SVE94589.1 EOG090X0H1B [Simocephalus serrulatus]